MRDITLRALDVLREVELVAAEDTRNTLNLLRAHGIGGKRLMALHAHNEQAGAEKIVTALGRGQKVALVTDAGTPAISDPGAVLVDAVRAAGFRVVPIPGPCAAVAALSAAGLPSPFLFFGFLPTRAEARRRSLEALRDLPHTLIFYEAPHRIEATLGDLAMILGDAREIVVARELTKLFEELHRCRLADVGGWLAADPHRRKGEFVLLVAGAAESSGDAEAARILGLLLAELPLARAVALAAAISGTRKNRLYELALRLRDGGPGETPC